MATTHHLQTNGLTERANRTLLQMIRRVCGELGGNWVKWLPLMELAYNSNVHSITRLSPFFVNFGYKPRLPATFLCPPPTRQFGDGRCCPVTAFCKQMQEGAQLVWEQVCKLSEAAGWQTEQRENIKRKAPLFQQGDEVLCYQFHLNQGIGSNTRKQQLRYAGPYRIKRVSSHRWAELEGLPLHMPTKLNFEYLRPYKRCLQAEALRNVPPPPKADVSTTRTSSMGSGRHSGYAQSEKTERVPSEMERICKAYMGTRRIFGWL